MSAVRLVDLARAAPHPEYARHPPRFAIRERYGYAAKGDDLVVPGPPSVAWFDLPGESATVDADGREPRAA